jgi:hypothetical protein
MPAGIETAIPSTMWPQTYALDSTATGMGTLFEVTEPNLM